MPKHPKPNVHCNTVYNSQDVKVKVTQSHQTLCYHMDYTVRGILQARILEWVTFPKYHMISLICGVLKKIIQMNLTSKQKKTQRIRK